MKCYQLNWKHKLALKFNSVVNTKSPAILSHWHNTRVSLDPLYSWIERVATYIYDVKINRDFYFNWFLFGGRWRGLKVSVLDSRVSTDQVILLCPWSKTICFDISSPHPGVYMGTSRLSGKSGEMLRENLAMDQHPIQGGVVILLISSYRSISVSGQLPTYPSPDPTLTLTCYQLTVVELGEG